LLSRQAVDPPNPSSIDRWDSIDPIPPPSTASLARSSAAASAWLAVTASAAAHACRREGAPRSINAWLPKARNRSNDSKCVDPYAWGWMLRSLAPACCGWLRRRARWKEEPHTPPQHHHAPSPYSTIITQFANHHAPTAARPVVVMSTEAEEARPPSTEVSLCLQALNGLTAWMVGGSRALLPASSFASRPSVRGLYALVLPALLHPTGAMHRLSLPSHLRNIHPPSPTSLHSTPPRDPPNAARGGGRRRGGPRRGVRHQEEEEQGQEERCAQCSQRIKLDWIGLGRPLGLVDSPRRHRPSLFIGFGQ